MHYSAQKGSCQLEFHGKLVSQSEQPQLAPLQLNQQHTANCIVVTAETLTQFNRAQPADAMITNLTALPLQLYTADCLPILFYHPSGVIGAVHAGRKGTELGVLYNTLQKNESYFRH